MSDDRDPAVWHVRTRGRERGPLTGRQLKAAADAGKLAGDAAVRKVGGPWRPAAEVKGLGAAEQTADAATDPDGGPAPPAERIDPAEVAAALADPPARPGRPREVPPDYEALRKCAAGLRSLGRLCYAAAVFAVAAAAVAGVALALSEETAGSVALSPVAAVLFAGVAAIYALPVAAAGFLLRCAAEGVGLAVNLAVDVRAVRDRIEADAAG